MKYATKLFRFFLSVSIPAVLLMGPVLSVHAQGLEEIIVTAQKREQDVQDVPIAITAVTGEIMETRGITNVAQVADYAPNVYMDSTVPFSGSNSVLAAYIRGIGQGDFAFNLEPGVGVYVDGVYMARTIGANVDLLDVERLEVLKGPQGTLFGRNTIGGAINVITRRPSNEFTYRGEVTTGSYDRIDVRGAVEMPIIENQLYGMVAFSTKSRDGYQDFINYDVGSHVVDSPTQFVHANYETQDAAGGENSANIRTKLLWVVNDDLEITVTGDYTKTDEQGTANTPLSISPSMNGSLNDVYDTCVSLPAAVLNTIDTNAGTGLPPHFGFNTTNGHCGPRGNSGYPHAGAPTTLQPALAGVNVDADPTNDRLIYGPQFLTGDIDTSYATGNNYNKLDMWGLSGIVDYDLANDWSLKYIGSYRYFLSQFALDTDGSPLVVNEPSFDTKQEQFSNEIQLSGLSWDDRWQWVVGFYQFHEEGDLTDYPAIGTGGMLQIYGQNFFDNDAWALFSHNNFALTDQIGITFGLRYTEETKDFEGKQRDLNNLAQKFGAPNFLFPDQADLTRYFPLGVNTKDFDDLTITAGLDYKLNDDMMAYFSYSEGFKSGGWTTRLSQPHLTTAPDAFNPAGLEFDEETATSYEIGLKSELLDNTLQLNLAGFFTEYDNIQVTQQIGASPVFTNGGTGEILGFEAETVWLATDELIFTGSVGWLDAEYTFIGPGVNDPVGVPVPLTAMWVNVPEWDVNVAGDYTVPLSSGAQLGLHADWSHTSEIANDFGNTAALIQDSVDLVNVSATYTAASDRWEIALGGRNVTDERHVTTGQFQPAAAVIYGTYNAPAQWYLTLRIRN